MITIFTDGSSKGNPGPGGWGAIIAYDDKVVELGGRDSHTTNNKMELTAAIKALESIPLDANAIVYSDATYVVKGITEWIHLWKKNNWRTAAKKPVENKELWQKLYLGIQGKDLDWRMVKGHSGVEANERCDEIATEFAGGGTPDLYNGPRESYSKELSINEV